MIYRCIDTYIDTYMYTYIHMYIYVYMTQMEIVTDIFSKKECIVLLK